MLTRAYGGGGILFKIIRKEEKCMKKIIVLLTMPLFMLSSCNMDSINIGNSSGNSSSNSETEETPTETIAKTNVIPVSRMNIVHQSTQTLIASSYDEYFDYYIYNLGNIQNVRIDNTAYQYKEYRGVESTETFEISVTETSSIKEMCKKAGSTVVSKLDSKSISANAGTNFGKKDLWNMTMSVGVSTTYSTSLSATSSWEESFEKASSLTKSEKHVLTIQWDDTYEQGYYIYAVIGVLNVYGVLVKEKSTGLFYYDTFTSLESYSYAFFFNDETPIFKRNYDTNLMFNIPEVESLEIPSNYIGLDKDFSINYSWNPIKFNSMLSVKAVIDYSDDIYSYDWTKINEYYDRGYTELIIGVSFSHQLDGSSREFLLEVSFINDDYKNDDDSFSSNYIERGYYSHSFVFSDYSTLIKNKYLSFRFVGKTIALGKTCTIYGLNVCISFAMPEQSE